MTHAQATQKLFNATDRATVNMILDNIAANYGITRFDALKEVTHNEAESILDYVTGPVRAATSVLMQKHRIAA